MKKLLLLLLLGLVFSDYANAQNKDGEKLTVLIINKPGNGVSLERFTQRLVKAAFMDAAFSTHIWLSDDGNSRDEYGYYRRYPQGYEYSQSIDSEIKRLYPWLYDYIVNPNGKPRFNSINKWNKPIVVSTQLPFEKAFKETNQTRWNPYVGMGSATANDYEFDSALEVFTQGIIENAARELSPLIGLPIEFLKQADETKENFGSIRIVFMEDMGLNSNPFRIERPYYGSFGTRGASFKYHIEPMLDTAVAFTAKSRSQVSGYFLSDEKNHIQHALCFIWQEHEEVVMKALIEECLVRAMGLPESMPENWEDNIDNSQGIPLLSRWNPEDQTLERLIYEGEVAFWKEELNDKRPPHAMHASKYVSRLKHKGAPSISPIDTVLLRILYDERIKAGMSPNHVKLEIENILQSPDM